MAAFINVKVEPLTVDLKNPRHKWCHWCGRVADYAVTRTGVISGVTHKDNACAQCAKGWQKEAGRHVLDTP